MQVPRLESQDIALEDFNEDMNELEVRMYIFRAVQLIKALQRDVRVLKDVININHPN